MYTLTVIAALALRFAAAQQTAYGQCGGIGWSGATTCVSGYHCVVLNDYYSQCQPGAASTSAPTTTRTSTNTPIPTTLKPTTTTKPATSTTLPTGAGPGATLQAGYYWIRAVESPNFHQYLQTSPTDTPGTAILSSPGSAGQFQIVDGQLVELVDSKGTLLYANVIPRTDSSVTKLAVEFRATKNTYGTFSFSGDATQWSTPDISRPNNSAWLVCAGQQLFINLGAYAYMTPAGCADETIHYYNGATAVS